MSDLGVSIIYTCLLLFTESSSSLPSGPLLSHLVTERAREIAWKSGGLSDPEYTFADNAD